jgi:hypothetical protein
METETVVANAVEAVAENIPTNRTAIIVTATAVTAVVGTVVVLKLKEKFQQKLAAHRAAQAESE